MGAYNIVNPASLVSGQPEDVSQVLANFQAIATILNGGIDNTNINAAAAIAASKFAGYPADVTKALRGDGTWGLMGGSRSVQAVNAANVDLAAPASTFLILSTGGGSVRSIGAAATYGTRVTIQNQAGAAITMKNQLAGGTGQQMVNRGLADLVLQNFESADYIYNSDNAWYEVSRDIAVVAGITTLADITLGANAGAIDSGVFSTAGYNHLRIYAVLRDTQAAATVNTAMRLNNDSSASYYYVNTTNGNGVLSSSGLSGAGSSMVMADHDGSLATAPEQGFQVYDIPFASTAGEYHHVMSNSFALGQATNATAVFRQGRGVYANSGAAISRVQLLAATLFLAGSRMIVYGLG